MKAKGKGRFRSTEYGLVLANLEFDGYDPESLHIGLDVTFTVSDEPPTEPNHAVPEREPEMTHAVPKKHTVPHRSR
jgi:hypothetical protein